MGTFRAPSNASAPLRPWPGFFGVLASDEDGASGFPSTALVFSLLGDRASIATSACNAPLSLS
jgi:hypothetical protein